MAITHEKLEREKFIIQTITKRFLNHENVSLFIFKWSIELLDDRYYLIPLEKIQQSIRKFNKFQRYRLRTSIISG